MNPNREVCKELTYSERRTYQAMRARGATVEVAKEAALDGVDLAAARKYKRIQDPLSTPLNNLNIRLDPAVHTREEIENMLGFLEGRHFKVSVSEQIVSQNEIDEAVASIKKEMG